MTTYYWQNSPLSIAFRKLRKMVASSPAFLSRSGIGTYSYDMSMTRVWTEYVPDQGELIADTLNQLATEPLMPRAAIWPIEIGHAAAAGGAQVYTLPSGMMHLYLVCQPLATINDWNSKREEAACFLDQWLLDVMALSGADDPTSDDGLGFLTITKGDAAVIDHSPFKDRATVGDFYYRSVALKFGDEG